MEKFAFSLIGVELISGKRKRWWLRMYPPIPAAIANSTTIAMKSFEYLPIARLTSSATPLPPPAPRRRGITLAVIGLLSTFSTSVSFSLLEQARDSTCGRRLRRAF